MTEKPIAPDPTSFPCAVCGCKGNMDCGHEPLDKERYCTLDSVSVCPCCRVKQKEFIADHYEDSSV